MEKKVVLVTGSSKGLGSAISRRFAAAGYHAIVTYHNDRAAGLAVVQAIIDAGGSATLHQLDVRSEESVSRLLSDVSSVHGRLDTLVSNAVTEIAKPIDAASLDEWHQVLLTKLDGAFLTTKYAIPLLVKSDNPSVIYITSGDGERPNGEFIGYQIGTAGLIAMTKANAVYLAKKFGIRVNAVSPGPVKTPLWDQLGGENEEMWRGFADSAPVKRIATPEDVADACYFLASDARKFLNGVFLHVDGGSQWT